MASILVIGATGYIGGRLVPRLIGQGHSVRVLARDPQKILDRGWHSVDICIGDLHKPETLPKAFIGIDIVYYLAHSMSAGKGSFEQYDRSAAWQVMLLSQMNNVQRIIYLGGLGKRSVNQSPHLRSRHEVGDILRAGSVPVTEFRAAIIIGSGSYSFEIIHHLVNRLPVMICPKWIYVKTQPIAIRDVLQYLIECIDKPHTAGKIYDIGGPYVMTYRDMMLTIARVLGLRRFLIPVPVLTPTLSSYWVNLFTPVPPRIARVLIESLRHETICENTDALSDFSVTPLPFEEAVHYAFKKVKSHEIETSWTDAKPVILQSSVDPSHLLENKQVITIHAPVDKVFSVITSLGGSQGWLYADNLWKIRGFIDKQIGGVGLRRGRRHPTQLSTGDALDFWRVEEYIPCKRLLLRAEMKVWGGAWLEFQTEPLDNGRTRLTQTARYYPKGLPGFVYWYGVYPLHVLVFRGMARAIRRLTEAQYIETEHISA
jgi:uncharacterized protein YbjT (DUF2867 family)/uncharacterized protein YndB with AHSA1/START domain